jgi:hypothetical protein
MRKLPWHGITIAALIMLAAWHSVQISRLQDELIDADNDAISAQMDADEALEKLYSLTHSEPERKAAGTNGI